MPEVSVESNVWKTHRWVGARLTRPVTPHLTGSRSWHQFLARHSPDPTHLLNSSYDQFHEPSLSKRQMRIGLPSTCVSSLVLFSYRPDCSSETDAGTMRQLYIISVWLESLDPSIPFNGIHPFFSEVNRAFGKQERGCSCSACSG